MKENRVDLLLATSAAAAAVLLARALPFDEPPVVDRRIRRAAQAPALQPVRSVMRPLFPIGLPGGYITIAYLLARSLRRRRRSGGPAIVTSAWAGWLVHRAIKLVYQRERPRRRGRRRRTESYPSGHTTGATALSVTAARVLSREGLISHNASLALGAVPPAVMGIYRVLADDHWATDVLGGWLTGAAIGLACDAALGETRSPRVPEALRRRELRHVRRVRQTSAV
ncbi:MAG TPA: phosphatase PAP2 family protein [Gemmatimonadaceae bacterium]